MFAGAFMMGAKDRLLPPSVPYRFFATAIIMHVAGWAALLAGATDLPGFLGGLGPVLAGLHLITLGVLAMTAMGAAFQMLPVATRRQLGPIWACRLTWWLFTPGVIVLSLGLGTAWPWALTLGAGLSVAGLAVFGVLVARNLMQVGDLPGVTHHAWIAMAALAALALLGILLVADIDGGFLPDRGRVAAAHAVLAGYGFMGMLAMGFSTVLIPMFILAQGPSERVSIWVARLSALALALAVGGILAEWNAVAALGGLVGLVAAGLHVRSLVAVLKSRMRKKLETFFRMVKAAWVMLPVSLACGVAALFADVASLWGLLLVLGWLLTFVTGILQRIMPFLASMHSGGGPGIKPIMLSQLVAERPLAIHAACHGAAIALIAAGMVAGSGISTALGAACGLAGALSFAVFAWLLMRRYQAHQQASSKPLGT
jgi:hypothetical protein